MIECKLSKILGERRIKMYQLAEKAGLSVNTVSLLYNDRWQQVQRETLNKVCHALDISIGELLEHVPDAQAEGKGRTKPKKK